MHHYELTLILRPELVDKDVTRIVQEMERILTDMGATVVSTRPERHGLARPIRKQVEAIYLFVTMTGPTDIPARIRAELKHRDDIMRLGIARLPEIPKSPATPETPFPAEAGNG